MFSNKKTRSSAAVVDGNLIISLPDAQSPVVWRMALGEARAAALQVVEKDGAHILTLKYPKGDSIEIAPFDTKEKATQALMAVAQAMQHGHGKIKPAAQDAAAAGGAPMPQAKAGLKWLIPLGLIVLAIFLFSRTSSMIPVDYAGNALATAAAPASDATGVPLSADNFLSGM